MAEEMETNFIREEESLNLEKSLLLKTETPLVSSFPSSVKFIVGNEFCERFSYYGMRTILALYLTNSLGLSDNTATEVVHLFIVAAYITPLLGAFLSDCCIGKYSTILCLSLVYCVGNWCMSASAYVTEQSLSTSSFLWLAAGIAFISLGTGGIKPCVSAFGGDQIELKMEPGPSRDTLLRIFFSSFYFAINAGAALSTLITPILRTYYSYSIAFGLPAILMIVAVFLFWSGRNDYAHRSPSGNIVTSIYAIINDALASRNSEPVKSDSEPLSHVREETVTNSSTVVKINGAHSAHRVKKRFVLEEGMDESSLNEPHWLDRAKSKHAEDDVEDVKQLLKVLTLFLPAPIFWSLFDQQSSRWVFQAEAMDGSVGWLSIDADQMQALNAILIMLLIPLFDRILYPMAERFRLSLRPIRRMVIGMFLCALAFLISGILQQRIDYLANASTPSFVSILWQVPQYVVMTAGEIMFSITGLELAYSQAPSTMTSVVTSFWLLTVAAGNLITVLVVESLGSYLTQAQEFYFFCLGCILAQLCLQWLGSSFIYVESIPDDISSDESP